MIYRVQRITQLSLILLASFALLNLLHPTNTYAKSHKHKHSKTRHSGRHYNPELTREQALNIMSGSEELSDLAGIDPNAKEVTTVQVQNTDNDNYYEPGEDIKELEAEDDVTVDMDAFKSLWLASVDDSDDEAITSNGIAKKDIMNVIMDWLGTPYHFGGLTDRGIDCSAFVQRVYLLSAQVHLPRTAQEQFEVGKSIKRTSLQFGDLIFFHTRRHAYASHVGIYLGDNLFAHASSRFGVTVSSLESTYYDHRFIGAKRLSPTDISKLGMND